MANDGGPVALFVSIGFIVVILFAFFAIMNAFNSTPQFHNLPSSQQSEIQTLQNLGGQAITMSDPTTIEIVVVILAAVVGGGGIIAYLKHK